MLAATVHGSRSSTLRLLHYAGHPQPVFHSPLSLLQSVNFLPPAVGTSSSVSPFSMVGFSPTNSFCSSCLFSGPDFSYFPGSQSSYHNSARSENWSCSDNCSAMSSETAFDVGRLGFSKSSIVYFLLGLAKKSAGGGNRSVAGMCMFSSPAIVIIGRRMVSVFTTVI